MNEISFWYVIGWFMLGMLSGLPAFMFIYNRAMMSASNDYRTKLAVLIRESEQRSAEHEALIAINQQRYIELRKRLGLPSVDKEWS